jgi:hypothetical protein
MPRPIALLTVLTLSLVWSLVCASANAQTMKPSAPQKMMSPAEAQKMHDCEKQAAAQNIKMDLRSKFVMDCMTAKK